MWKGRLNYTRKLFGMALIVASLILFTQSKGINFLILFGAFFLLEHYFIWDRWDFYDFITGHEWWGMYLMTIGFIIYGNIFYLITIWAGFLIGARYNKFNVFKDFLSKVDWILGGFK